MDSQFLLASAPAPPSADPEHGAAVKRPRHLSSLRFIHWMLVAIAATSTLLNSSVQAFQNPTSFNPDENIAEVRPAGNRAIPTQKIMAEIKTRAGLPPDRRLIEEDVR